MANPSPLVVSSTLLVRLTRGKLSALLRSLREQNRANSLTGGVLCLDDRPIWLDLFQIAHLSQECATQLLQWKCTTRWGSRFDGVVPETYQDALRTFYWKHEGTWWTQCNYGLCTLSTSSVCTMLEQVGIPCSLNGDLPEYSLLKQISKQTEEKSLIQPEVLCTDSSYPVPLTWSPNSQRLLYGWHWDTHQDDLYLVDRKQRKARIWMRFSWLREMVGGADLGVLTGAAWSPNGKFLALSFVNDTLVLRVRGTRILHVIPHAGYQWTTLSWSPDSQRLALGFVTDEDPVLTGGNSLNGGNAFNIGIWDLHTQMLVLTYRGHNERACIQEVRSLSWSADGCLLASAGTDGDPAIVHIWDSTTGALRFLYRGHTDGVTTVRFVPAGDVPLVASSGSDGTIQVWHALTGEQMFTATHDGPSAYSGWPCEQRVAWSPDGQFLAFQNTKQELVQLYLPTKHITILQALGPYTLQDLAWSSDGTCLATRAVDFTEWEECQERICLWSLDQLLKFQKGEIVDGNAY